MEEFKKAIRMSLRFIALLSVVVLLVNCVQKKMDASRLCMEFYQLNKNKNFDGLFDVAIAKDRVKSVYNDSLRQNEMFFNWIAVFDSDSGFYVRVPVFRRGADIINKKSVFRSLTPSVRRFLTAKLSVKSDTAALYDSYVNYIESTYAKYYGIAVPPENNNKNIGIEGNPMVGKFITFDLTKTAKVYYLADKSSPNEYWSTHFNKITKIDQNWYYEVVPAKDK